MIRDRLAAAIAATAQQLYGVEIQPEVSYTDPQFGDFASNVALVLAGQLQKKPQEIAQRICSSLKSPAIATVKAAGNGFINITVTDEALVKTVAQIGSETAKPAAAPRVMLEYGHPNTHKLPHIGHLFSYVAGDSLARILAAAGNQVRKVNYQGDVGLHVAKCLYRWIEQGRPTADSPLEKVKILQQCYESGNRLYSESPEAAAAIKTINQQIYNQDPEVSQDWQTTRQWSLDYYQELEARLGIEQKTHYLESQVWQLGKEIVQKQTGKVFIESDGAIIFPGAQLGLHNRVFITKEGTATYEAKELGLNLMKSRDWAYDLTVVPTAREQNEYFQVVIAAINQAIPELKDKVKHIGFGHVNLASAKMSSRGGNILSAPQLLELVTAKAAAAIADNQELSSADKPAIANQVALGAIKYSLLKSDLGKQISFDVERDVSLHGNAGPYLQYCHARACSLLRKAKAAVKFTSPPKTEAIERTLLLMLTRFNEIVALAATEYAPHYVCTYLYELAQAFNQFYETHQIIGEPEESFRLALTQKTRDVLAEGLELLGISAPERM